MLYSSQAGCSKRGGRDENADVASRSVFCSYPLGLRDFSGCGTIVDVGGGHGGLIASILKKHANFKGVVYDSPQVVAGAPALFEEHGVVERATAVGGDFFKSVPADGDTYVMKHIIHDWYDDKCTTLLKHCHGVSHSILA
jgi:hypothetical protein